LLDAEFAINARAETVAPGFRKTLRHWGYLVPPRGLTRALQESIGSLARANVPLIVDNGLFDDITRISNKFAARISRAKTAIAQEEARLRRTPEWRDLKKPVSRERLELARQFAEEAQKAEGMGLLAQLALATSGVIGAEDITAALWLRAGLDSPSMPIARQELRHRNRAVAQDAATIIKTLPRKVRSTYLPVASAFDYNTAYDAGQRFADAGLGGGAMGFGAFMADNSFADQIVMNRRTHRLPRPLPMRYLRTALVARGFWDGWRDATGKAPRRFHFLGLGAPIMIPLVALAARGTPLLTFDATSPIRDAVEGTLYSSLGAYLKIRTRRFAWRLATGQLRSWTCPCGFCRSFVRKYPFNYSRGRLWGSKHPDSEDVSASVLRPGGDLYSAYPLMSEPRGGARRKAVSYARSGHNHWVVAEVMRDLRKHGKKRLTLEKHVECIVGAYQRSTSDSHFAEAVSLGFDIVRGRFPK
jgi:hypothetical protein